MGGLFPHYEEKLSKRKVQSKIKREIEKGVFMAMYVRTT